MRSVMPGDSVIPRASSVIPSEASNLLATESLFAGDPSLAFGMTESLGMMEAFGMTGT